MVRRRRRAAGAADGPPAEGLLTEGETVASDQFSFLPPGVPAGGAGGLGLWVCALRGGMQHGAMCARGTRSPLPEVRALLACWPRGVSVPSHFLPGSTLLQCAPLTTRLAWWSEALPAASEQVLCCLPVTSWFWAGAGTAAQDMRQPFSCDPAAAPHATS